jgi:hypothetical protein
MRRCAHPPASTACPPALHSLRWLSTRCGGRRGWGVSTVLGMSQTPLYDQLRDERINADVAARHGDVPVGEVQQDPLVSVDLRLVGDGGSAAGGARGASWGSDTDLGAESACAGRHHRRDEVPGVHGSGGLSRHWPRSTVAAADTYVVRSPVSVRHSSTSEGTSRAQTAGARLPASQTAKSG